MSERTLYLRNGLLGPAGLRPELEAGALRIARHWVADGLDPARVEVAAELLARMAEQVADGRLQRVRLLAALEAQGAAAALLELLEVALGEECGGTEVAAAAVHVLDIAEQMALQIYVAELPSLLARADRSGDAARKVGIARHLRG